MKQSTVIYTVIFLEAAGKEVASGARVALMS